MLYAKLEKGDSLYVFLHAEQVYRDFIMCDKHLGYFSNNALVYSSNNILGYSSNKLAENTIYDICNFIKNDTTHSNVVIDCAEINDAHNIAGWIKDIISNCKKKGKRLTFCRMCETLYEKSKIHGQGLEERNNDDRTYNVFSASCDNNSIIDDDIYDTYKQIIADRINTSYIIERMGDDSYSHSGNVQLPRYINIKKFIEQKELLFIGVYLLCKMAYSNGLIGPNKQPLLFFSSMAGSYLASLLSKLACVDMVFLNHLGPKKKLYRELHKEQLVADRDYLIISDVVCLGAEIERAKTLIEYAGGHLKGILSIVLVEVVSERPKIENEIEKIALLTLTKDYNPIDYQIVTDFPKK